MMKKKSRAKSKTYWFGGSLAVLGLAIFGLPEFGEFVANLPPEYQGGAALVVGIATMVLREVTKEPVG